MRFLVLLLSLVAIAATTAACSSGFEVLELEAGQCTTGPSFLEVVPCDSDEAYYELDTPVFTVVGDAETRCDEGYDLVELSVPVTGPGVTGASQFQQWCVRPLG
jgi:hypothetical protein